MVATVTSVGGSQATLSLHGGPAGAMRITVGKFLAIRTTRSQVIGVITLVADESNHESATARVDMLGEIMRPEGKKPFFQRGVSEYPAIGDHAELIQSEDLRLIYDISGPRTINLGALQQDESVGAYVDVDEMLCKHFAILGTTGVGKSSGVSLILNEILDARPNTRIFLIDPHNEYGRCFRGRAEVLNPKNLKLPFWLFNFEETIDVFFRGRPGVEEEVEILVELLPLAKAQFASGRGDPGRFSIRKAGSRITGFTVDTPVPYRIADLIALIDERMGKLENRSSVAKYSRLISRIETVRNDPRYSFMFDNANVGGDTMAEVLGQLFRLPANGKPMTVMQLAGFPAEVVDAVVSVVCRMAFDFGLWSDGASPILVVCEESHRYAPADRSIGFGPTRKAISRIAKEGRKYGVYIGLVTQRPAELDTTIISQCSTLFAMRMANDRDQAIVKSAVSDAAASLLAFVPALGVREVFAFGEGVALPTRLRFKALAPDQLPKAESIGIGELDSSLGIDDSFISSVVERWRGATMSNKLKMDEKWDDLDPDVESPPLESQRIRPPPANIAPPAAAQPHAFSRRTGTFGKE